MSLKLLSELYKGEWSATTAYTIGDTVNHNGSSYACILANLNQEPPSATYWVLWASQGATGSSITGPIGNTGPTGADSIIPGPTGPTGPSITGSAGPTSRDSSTRSGVKVFLHPA